MAIRDGHADCWHCSYCGLPICLDCDSEGRSCSFNHDPERDRYVDEPARRPRPKKKRGATR